MHSIKSLEKFLHNSFDFLNLIKSFIKVKGKSLIFSHLSLLHYHKFNAKNQAKAEVNK
jgi:hypothetical protein